MKPYLILPFFIGLLFISSVLWAQQSTIEGIITDENKKPLEFVSIAIEGTSRGTSTNANGFFRLQADFTQTQRVVVSYLGYKIYEYEITLTPGELRRLDIQLEPLATLLPDIEVRETQIITS
ncbi:MAG: carboxypeptidase-like regulatory domain-containing protein, partial [Bacteroidales bacterium]|nr:carboxypeptidase-like regulatory domain-containing protein [Bacteroidales bacterium]